MECVAGGARAPALASVLQPGRPFLTPLHPCSRHREVAGPGPHQGMWAAGSRLTNAG